MKTLALLMLIACGAVGPGCKKAESKPAAATSAGNPVTAPLDYLAAQGRAKKFAEKTISTAELTSAIQKFQGMEDRYPRDLNELAQQHYLQAPPVPPRGMRFLYNPQNGEIRIVREDPPTALPK